MILFTILAITAILLLIFTVFVVSVGGATMLIVFGDVVVCIFIIGWLIKFFIDRR